MEVTLPVLKPRGGSGPNCDASSDDSLSNELALVEGQLADVERLLHNIFEWKQVVETKQFDGAWGEDILKFVQNTFLTFLSSQSALTQSRAGLSLSSTVAWSFARIWKLIKATNWLDRPEWLVELTTLAC